eukprot:PLAT4007.1.p1 GENE.PLAT4007.1~~PLAT4007.1.p1  ORF type:complete len:254 (+),score=17.78 PLAT4007.1:22-762(+)
MAERSSKEEPTPFRPFSPRQTHKKRRSRCLPRLRCNAALLFALIFALTAVLCLLTVFSPPAGTGEKLVVPPPQLPNDFPSFFAHARVTYGKHNVTNVFSWKNNQRCFRKVYNSAGYSVTLLEDGPVGALFVTRAQTCTESPLQSAALPSLLNVQLVRGEVYHGVATDVYTFEDANGRHVRFWQAQATQTPVRLEVASESYAVDFLSFAPNLNIPLSFFTPPADCTAQAIAPPLPELPYLQCRAGST